MLTDSPVIDPVTVERRIPPTAGKLLDRMSVEREAYDHNHLKAMLGNSLSEEWGASAAAVIIQD